MPPKLTVVIVGDTAALEKSFARAQKATAGFGKKMEGAGRGAASATLGFKGLGRAVGFASAGFIGGAGLAAGVKAAFGEMADSQKVAAQTAAVLKSTGGAANVTAGQVDKLADALLKKSGVDDEQIKSGENLLLTFTNIRNELGKGNDVFNQATKVALDMSVALGQDMKQSALQLGKALNDPVKGVTALQRVGVSFTAAQRDQIKALVAAGDTMKAQKLILAELNKEFGGSAEAAGKTLPGQLNKLRETLLNLGGTLAEKVAPALQGVLEDANKWLSNAKNQQKIIGAVTEAAHAFTGALGVVKQAFEGLNAITGSTKHTLELLIGSFVAFKALKMASTVAGIAKSFGLLSTAQGGATASTRTLSKSLLGKAGLAGAAGVASFEIATLALKATGLDKKLKSLGGTAFDTASALGLVHDPGKQFEGKTVLSPQASAFLRRQAARLEISGFSEAGAVTRIAGTHPNVATRDIQTLAHFGSRRLLERAAAVVVPVTVELDGHTIARVVAHHNTKADRRKPTQVRGQQTR